MEWRVYICGNYKGIIALSIMINWLNTNVQNTYTEYGVRLEGKKRCTHREEDKRSNMWTETKMGTSGG